MTRPSFRVSAIVSAAVVLSLLGIQISSAGSRTSPGAAVTPGPRTALATSPAFGPTRGGTRVTIRGVRATGVTAVRFGPRAARFQVVDTTTITAVAPSGTGTVVIRVTNPSGHPKVSAHGRFTYLAMPSVRSIAPTTGPSVGGTTVLVYGTGFAPGARVLVGGRAARAVRVRNPDALVAVVPSGFGSLALRVVTPGGTSHPRSSVRFAYRSKVLVIGDSLGIDLGWGFSNQLPGNRFLEVTDLAVGSSGLVRWDYYDWPSKLRADLRAVRPQFVVALFGANDQQPIHTASGSVAVGTSAWVRAYESRARLLASIVTSSGASLAWVGLPRMGPHSVIAASFVDDVNRADRDAARTNPKVTLREHLDPLFKPVGGLHADGDLALRRRRGRSTA